MNKIYGSKNDFTLVKEDASRIIISYGFTPDADGEHATWKEIDFYKKQGKPSFAQVKEAIKADINAATDERIIKGFVWNGIPVWLSEENQRNFSEAQRIAAASPDAILPVKFKMSEDEEGNPVYHTFETAEELTSFYLQAVGHVNSQLSAGWDEKDGIDWSAYEAILVPKEQQVEGKKSRKSSK